MQALSGKSLILVTVEGYRPRISRNCPIRRPEGHVLRSCFGFCPTQSYPVRASFRGRMWQGRMALWVSGVPLWVHWMHVPTNRAGYNQWES